MTDCLTGRCRTECGVNYAVQPEPASTLRRGSSLRVSREGPEHPPVQLAAARTRTVRAGDYGERDPDSAAWLQAGAFPVTDPR